MKTAMLILVLTFAAGQDRNPPEAASNDCDVKKTAAGLWCDACDKGLEKTDLDKKTKKCGACEGKPRKVLFCVKTFFQAECHPEKIDLKPIKCCKKTHKKPHYDKALVVHKCQGCGQSDMDARKLKHADECKKKKLAKSCKKSGEGRHVKAKR